MSVSKAKQNWILELPTADVVSGILTSDYAETNFILAKQLFACNPRHATHIKAHGSFLKAIQFAVRWDAVEFIVAVVLSFVVLWKVSGFFARNTHS